MLRSIDLTLTIIILVGSLLLLESLLRQYGIKESPLNGNSIVAARILLIMAVLLFVDRFTAGTLRLYAERSEALHLDPHAAQ